MTTDVTIAILPREKFSQAETSLDSLLANTHTKFKLIYVDGNSPSEVREAIERRLASVEDSQIIHIDRFLGPFEGAAIAIENATTPYLVIADNDVFFRPGWLEALQRCACEQDADAVTPLILIGGTDSDVIHAAGGTAHIEVATGGQPFYQHHQNRENERYSDVTLGLRREQTELLESHCILAKTATWRMLELDPKVGHSTNVAELAFGFQRIGARCWFEPTSQVVYLFGEYKLVASDFRFWRWAWSQRRLRSDLRRMDRVHGFQTPSKLRHQEIWWMADHRRVWLRHAQTRINRTFARIHLAAVGLLVWKVVEAVEVVWNVVTISSGGPPGGST